MFFTVGVAENINLVMVSISASDGTVSAVRKVAYLNAFVRVCEGFGGDGRRRGVDVFRLMFSRCRGVEEGCYYSINRLGSFCTGSDQWREDTEYCVDRKTFTNSDTGKQTHGQTDRDRHSQTDGQTDRQTDLLYKIAK